MKLNSTMKHRRIHIRLLISMLTVALRFSYLLISKDSVFNAMIGTEYVYTDYSVTTVEGELVRTVNGSGTSAIVTVSNSLTVSIDLNGYYDGKYQLLISGINTSQYYTFEAVNCVITDFTAQSNSWSVDLQIYGVQHFEFKINVQRTGTGINTNVLLVMPLFSSVSDWYNKTYVCSSPTYLVERINSKLSDLKNYTDGIEGALSTIASSLVSTNTNLVTINSTLIDMYNRQNITNGKLDTINTGMNSLISLLTYSDQVQHNIPRTLETINSHTQGTEEYLRQIKDIVKDLNPTQQTNVNTEINTYNNLSGQVDTIINNNITTALGNFPSINDAVNNFVANNVTTMNKVRSAVTSVMPAELNTLFGTYFMLMAFGMLIVVMLG